MANHLDEQFKRAIEGAPDHFGEAAEHARERIWERVSNPGTKRRSLSMYIGIAAAILLLCLFGLVYQQYQLQTQGMQLSSLEATNQQLEASLATQQQQNREALAQIDLLVNEKSSSKPAQIQIVNTPAPQPEIVYKEIIKTVVDTVFLQPEPKTFTEVELVRDTIYLERELIADLQSPKRPGPKSVTFTFNDSVPPVKQYARWVDILGVAKDISPQKGRGFIFVLQELR